LLAGAWALLALWQLAHDCVPVDDSEGSLKINSPKAAVGVKLRAAACAVVADELPVFWPPPPQALRASATHNATNSATDLSPQCIARFMATQQSK
jgi:hypothetical protein